MIQVGDTVICNEKAVSPFKGWVGHITKLDHGRAYVQFNGLLGSWMSFREIRHMNAIEKLAWIDTK